jgi:hypothetical protein
MCFVPTELNYLTTLSLLQRLSFYEQCHQVKGYQLHFDTNKGAK